MPSLRGSLCGGSSKYQEEGAGMGHWEQNQCLEQQRVAQEHCAPLLSQSASGEEHCWCLHLLQSCKSSVKTKSTPCRRGRGNSWGGTAGRVSFGEGECDQRVSVCCWFIWVHLAPLWEVLRALGMTVSLLSSPAPPLPCSGFQ